VRDTLQLSTTRAIFFDADQVDTCLNAEESAVCPVRAPGVLQDPVPGAVGLLLFEADDNHSVAAL